MIYKGFSSLYLTSPTPYQKKKKKSKKKIFIFIYEYKCIYQTMFAYFTELARWVGGTTGLVVSYVKGLLFGDDPADSSITETPVHRQADETIEEVVDNETLKLKITRSELDEWHERARKASESVVWGESTKLTAKIDAGFHVYMGMVAELTERMNK